MVVNKICETLTFYAKPNNYYQNSEAKLENIFLFAAS